MSQLLKLLTPSAITKKIIRGSKWDVIASTTSKVKTLQRLVTKMTGKPLSTCLTRHRSSTASSLPLPCNCWNRRIPSMKTSTSFFSAWPCATMPRHKSLNRPKLRATLPSTRAIRVYTRRKNRSCSSRRRMATSSNSETTAC